MTPTGPGVDPTHRETRSIGYCRTRTEMVGEVCTIVLITNVKTEEVTFNFGHGHGVSGNIMSRVMSLTVCYSYTIYN